MDSLNVNYYIWLKFHHSNGSGIGSVSGNKNVTTKMERTLIKFHHHDSEKYNGVTVDCL